MGYLKSIIKRQKNGQKILKEILQKRKEEWLVTNEKNFQIP